MQNNNSYCQMFHSYWYASANRICACLCSAEWKVISRGLISTLMYTHLLNLSAYMCLAYNLCQTPLSWVFYLCIFLYIHVYTHIQACSPWQYAELFFTSCLLKTKEAATSLQIISEVIFPYYSTMILGFFEPELVKKKKHSRKLTEIGSRLPVHQ